MHVQYESWWWYTRSETEESTYRHTDLTPQWNAIKNLVTNQSLGKFTDFSSFFLLSFIYFVMHVYSCFYGTFSRKKERKNLSHPLLYIHRQFYRCISFYFSLCKQISFFFIFCFILSLLLLLLISFFVKKSVNRMCIKFKRICKWGMQQLFHTTYPIKRCKNRAETECTVYELGMVCSSSPQKKRRTIAKNKYRIWTKSWFFCIAFGQLAFLLLLPFPPSPFICKTVAHIFFRRFPSLSFQLFNDNYIKKTLSFQRANFYLLGTPFRHTLRNYFCFFFRVWNIYILFVAVMEMVNGDFDGGCFCWFFKALTDRLITHTLGAFF